MVTPGMLQNPSVRTWLGDVVPAWTLLDQAGLSALRHPPHPRNGPIRFATDLSPEEIHLSAIARNALILLHAAEIGPGLKLTATGNLSRTVVAEMLDLFSWPDLDKAEAFGFNKVINEPDFLPLFLVRHLVQAAGTRSKRAVRNCTGDEGWPFEVGNQVLISSHRKLLLSKAMVVSVAETSGHDPDRQG